MTPGTMVIRKRLSENGLAIQYPANPNAVIVEEMVPGKKVLIYHARSNIALDAAKAIIKKLSEAGEEGLFLYQETNRAQIKRVYPELVLKTTLKSVLLVDIELYNKLHVNSFPQRQVR